MNTARLRVGALACALVAVCLGGSAAAAADSTPPTLVVTTAPANPTSGSDVTITATVTPGANPDSTGLAVNCDLSWAGQPPSVPLTSDATGLVFTTDVAIPDAAVPGERDSSCMVTDDQNRFSSAQYSVTIASPTADEAPTVTSHTPASDATDVAPDANIGIVFSEPVDVTGDWYTIECDTPGPHTAVVTGGPTSYLLNPDADLPAGETCTVTLDPTLITDSASNNLSGEASWSFTVATPSVTYSSLCGLVNDVVTDPAVAAGLCAKLAAASRAGERGDLGAEQNQLRAFRNQVDAQTSKAISPANAALLKELSTRL